jgi:DNA-binding transcriptional LysR family regulator
VLRSADEGRCAAAVAAGLGVSLMPRSLLRPHFAVAEIKEVSLERRVVLAWQPGTDEGLVQILREAAQAHDRLAFAR